MSSDVRLYLKCVGCGERHRFVRFTISKHDVILDDKINEFISCHISCNDYLFDDVFGENSSKYPGFTLERENDGDLAECG